MIRTYMCIGGPKDGEVVSVDGQTMWRTAVMDPIPPAAVPTDAEPPLALDWRPVVYREEIMVSADGQGYGLWIAEGLTTADALSRLIGNYRPPTRRDRP